MRSSAAVAAASAVLGLVVGCTGRPATSSSPDQLGDRPLASMGAAGATATPSAGVAALVQEFGTAAFGDPPGAVSVTLATEEVARRCMARKGFSYSYDSAATRRDLGGANSSATVRGPASPVDPSQGFGLYAEFAADPSMASPPAHDSGHGADEDPPADPNTAGMADAQKKSYYLALNGYYADRVARKNFDQRTKFTVSVPAALLQPGQKLPQDAIGGCFGRGELAVWAGRPQELDKAQFMQQALSGAIGEAENAPGSAYEKAMGVWQSCMAAQGYHFKTSGDAYDAAYDRYVKDGGATSDAHSYELAVARQDAACQKSSGVVQASNEVARSAATAFVVKWEPVLLQSRHDWRKAVARAKTILAGGTPSPLATALASPAPVS